MKLGRIALACLCGALACTGASNTNPPLPPTGNGGSGFGGSGLGGQPPPSGNLVIEIQEPMTGLIALAGTLIDVRARVFIDQGSDFVDPTSVEATVMAEGDTAELESTTLAPQGMDLFSGRVSLGDQPTGNYVLWVSATSSNGTKHREMIPFQIDAGPILVVRSPQALHAYKGLLVIEVLADAGPFGPLDGPYATVANYDVPLTPVLDPSGNPVPSLYRGTIDLHDPKPGTIVPPLQNEQLLTVWATNGNNKRVDIHLVFFIDEAGPIITMTTPAAGEIAGNIVRISAVVTDPSGVLDSSVIAVIGDDTHPALFNVQLKPDGLGVYSVLFDSRKLAQCPDPPSTSDLCLVFPTISFRASDELGNERAVGYGFALDNIAPVADLDPPNLRSFKLDETGVRCSWEFDPLSNNDFVGDMPNDRTTVPQVFDLRARIEDDGNHAVGLKLPPLSLVDRAKTAVYVLDDESKALIVDTDGDGWCDAINPLLVPTTEPPTTNDQVLKIGLAPVTRDGQADFTPDGSLPSTPGPLGLSSCPRGVDPLPPPALCTFLQPSIAIGYAFDQPAIWSVDQVDKVHCFGNQFDALANNISEGWACIAVATTDFSNNSGVSPPLRVNIQYKYTGRHGQIAPGTPPACTGTYDRVMKTVTNGPCKTRRFERQPDLSDYYCYGRECPSPFVPL